MATETLYATSLTSGTVATSANALGAPNGTFTTDVDNVSWTARFAMGNPVGNTANGTHTITLRVRKETGTGTPTVNSITLYSGGTLLGTIGTGNWSITSTTGQDVSATYLPSELPQFTLADLEVQVATTGVGGSGGVRTCVQLDAITWSGDFTTVSQDFTGSGSATGSGTLTASGTALTGGATTIFERGTIAIRPGPTTMGPFSGNAAAQVGDLEVWMVASKPASQTLSISSTGDTWTELSSEVVGTGTDGLDAGPVRITTWYRVLTATGSTTTVTQPDSTANTMLGMGMTYYKSGSDPWSITSSSGGDVTADTNFTATMAANQGFQAGEFLTQMAANTRSDGGAVTARSTTLPGLTATHTPTGSSQRTDGNRMYAWFDRCSIDSGSQTGAATVNGTFTTAATGGVTLVRIAVGAGSSENHTGSAALSGSGSLGVTVVVGVARTTALTGSGTLTASATPALARTVAATGSGALTASSNPAFARTGATNGSGTLAATAVPAHTGTAALASAGSLAATAQTAVSTSVALTGSGTLTATSGAVFAGSAPLDGAGTLVAGTEQVVVVTTVALGDFWVDEDPWDDEEPLGTSALSVTWNFLVAATVSPLAGEGTLAATGVAVEVPAYADTANLAGSGALSAEGRPALAEAATLSGVGAIGSAVAVHTSGASSTSGVGSLVASGVASPRVSVTLAGSGTLATATASGGTAAVSLSGSGTLTAATGTARIATSVSVTGVGSLVAAGRPTVQQQAYLTGDGTLTSVSVSQGGAGVSLGGSGLLAAQGQPSVAVQAALTGGGTLRGVTPLTVFKDVTVAVGSTRVGSVTIGAGRADTVTVSSTRHGTLAVAATRQGWSVGPTRDDRGA